MNLAEIRKKAREGKSGDAKPAPVPTGHPPPFEAEDQGVGQAVSLPEVEYPSTGVAHQEAATPCEADSPDAVLEPFDPIAVVLAGRRAAGSVSETVDSAADSTGDGGALRKYLRFRVADEEYGVSLLEIREIIKPREITEVPRMPPFVVGVLSLRGTIIPVFDLRLRLGLPVSGSTGGQRIVIARKGEGSCGLLVDEVFQVIGLADSSLEKAPAVLEGIDREFVKGIGRHGERMLILLDLEMIMDVSLR